MIRTCLPITLVSAVTLAVFSFTTYLPVRAQSAKPINKTLSNGRVRFLFSQQPPDFSGDGRPGRRAGGGSRSPCPPINPTLTALMPVTNLGKTVASHPTFWFYVPYSSQQAPAGEFVLQSEQGNDVYRTRFTLPKTPGLVSFSTPPTAAPIEINKSYHWYFKLYCEPQKASAPIFVEGWVQRVELTPALESQLSRAKAREYEVYAANGIWYDAIARLADLRLSNPLNARLNDEWTNLLSARGVSLSQLSRAPIVGRVMLLPIVDS